LDKLERCEPLAKDSTLTAPYEELDHRILQLEKSDASGCSKRAQLNLIIAVVSNAKNRHLQRMKDEVAKRKQLARPFSDGRLSFTSLPIVERQDILRSLSAEYAADLHAVFEKCTLFDSMGSIRRIAASYAYYSTYSNARESRLVLFTTFDSSTQLKYSVCLDFLMTSRFGTWLPSKPKLLEPHLPSCANLQNALFSIAPVLNYCNLCMTSISVYHSIACISLRINVHLYCCCNICRRCHGSRYEWR
jgi:hypothetical protein